MSTVAPGDALPDIPPVEPGGGERSPAGFVGERTLSTLLRHLAGPPCREHLAARHADAA